MPRLDRLLVVVGALITLGVSSVEVRAQTPTITVCNKGSAKLWVATLDFFDVLGASMSSARAWIDVAPTRCVDADYGANGRVNLAFLRESANGPTPYVAKFNEAPDGVGLRLKYICVPRGGVKEVISETTALARYRPPCNDATDIQMPVSFTAYIQGDYRLTLDVSPKLEAPSLSMKAADLVGLWKVIGSDTRDANFLVRISSKGDSVTARVVENTSAFKLPVAATYFRGTMSSPARVNGHSFELLARGRCARWPASLTYDSPFVLSDDGDTLTAPEELVRTDTASCTLTRRAGVSVRKLTRFTEQPVAAAPPPTRKRPGDLTSACVKYRVQATASSGWMTAKYWTPYCECLERQFTDLLSDGEWEGFVADYAKFEAEIYANPVSGHQRLAYRARNCRQG